MPAHGGIGVVKSPKEEHERPESPMTEKSPRTRHRPTDSASTPRFLGQIGNVKPSGRHEGGLLRAKAGADGPRRSREEATEREPWLRVGTPSDGDISHVTQLERELESELSQSEAATAQVPEPRHVKYATVMAKNLRYGSQRTVNPGARRSVDKTRMTPEERRELVRAQREVIWNLQKGDIVTIVNPGDDPVPYKRQGNPDVNTPLSVKKRQALRKKPLIQEISNEYWCFPGLNPEGSDEMTKESYLKLNRKLHLALIPDTTDADAQNSAEVDWVRDTQRWGGRMTREAFASSMFELADIWTENIDEEEYTAFLWLLLETITNTNVVPPSFKPDREIECIVDKDLSEATNRIRDTLANSAERERTPPRLNTDAIAAVLSASRDARGNLSPKLKDKHVQRLRALRQRLQALKQLRTWTALGRTGDKSNGSGADVDGVGGVEEVAEIGRGDYASSQGRYDTLIEDGGSALIEGAAGSIADSHAAGDQSNEVTRKDSSAALEDGEKHGEGLGSELRGHSLPSGDGRGAESGNGSGADQMSSLERHGGVDHTVGRDRENVDHLSDTSSLSNSSHHRTKAVRSGRDGVRTNDDLEVDSMKDREIPGLYHRLGASPSTPSSPSAAHAHEAGFSAKEQPLQRYSGLRGGEVFSSYAPNLHEAVDDEGSIRKRMDKENDGAANGETLGGVRGGVYGANIANGSVSKRDLGVQEYPRYASTKNTAEGAAGDARGSGFANDDDSDVQARGKRRDDGVYAGVLEVEGVADANGHQKPAWPSLEERQGEAAVKNQSRGGDTGGTDYEGATIKSNNESSRSSNINGNSDSNNRDGGEVDHTFVRHDTSEGVSAQDRARPLSGGDPNLLQREILGAATNDHVRIPRDVHFDQRVGAEDHREPGGGGSDAKKHHKSKDSDRGPKGGHRTEDTAEELVSNPKLYGAAGGAPGSEGKEGDRASPTPHEVRDRWTSSVPGGVPGDDGVLFVNPEESSLQDDGCSTLSSISSGQLRPSLTKGKKARKVRVRREQGQGQEDEVKAGAVNGGGPGRGERMPTGAGTGGGSHDVSSAADNRSNVSRRQSARRSNEAGGSTDKGRYPSTSPFRGPRSGTTVPSKFHPGGVHGGWDGISGTTDAEWDQMIQQAKAERKRRTSTSRLAAKQGSTARRRRPSGKARGRKGSTGSTKEAPETTGSLESFSEAETCGSLADGEASLSGSDIKSRAEDPSYAGDASRVEPLAAALPVAGGTVGVAGAKGKSLAPLGPFSPTENESEEEGNGGVSGREGLLFAGASTDGDRHREEVRRSFSSHGGENGGLDLGGLNTNAAANTGSTGAEKSAANQKMSATSGGPRGGDAISTGADIPEDLLARLQPVLEKHDMSAVGVFDGSSTTLDLQGSSSLGAQDGSEETSCNPLLEARISSTIPNGSQSGQDDLHAVGAVATRDAGKENGSTITCQPVAQAEPEQVPPREGIHAASRNAIGHAPGGLEGTRRHVVDEDTYSASLDRPLASASEDLGVGKSSDDNRPAGVHRASVGAHDGQVRRSREPITVAASSHLAASGDGSLQQEMRHMGEDASPVDELVADRGTSRTPRENNVPQADDQASLVGGVDDQASLVGGQGGLVGSTPPQKRTGDESTTDLEHDAGKGPSVLRTNFYIHQEDPAAEGLLELHHEYRQIARPRTRSGSRAGTVGYGSTGGGNAGPKKDDAAEGKGLGKAPRCDEPGVEMAAPKCLEERNRSERDEAGRANDSSPGNSAASKLDEQRHGESAGNTHDPKSVFARQSDSVGSAVRSPLNEESAAGASPGTEAKQNAGVLQPSLEETDTLHGENRSSAFTTFAAASGKEDATNAMGSWDGGDLPAADRAAERAGSGNSRTAVPNCLSSNERGRSEDLRLSLRSGKGDDGSVLKGAQVEMEGIRDASSNRRVAGRKDVLSSIAVAGKRMSVDSEKREGRQQGTAVGSNAAAGRKNVTAKGREGGETQRRSSSSGVWRYDGLEQHQLQQSRGAVSSTSLSVNNSSQGDVGRANLPAGDGRVSSSFRIGEPRRDCQQKHRIDSSRQTASSSSGVAIAQVFNSASAPEAFGGVGGRATVTSDADIPVSENDPAIAIMGGDLLEREERGLAKVRKFSAEHPNAEEAPFGIVGRGATLAIPFADTNGAHSEQGGNGTPPRSPVVQGNSIAAVANGWPSTVDKTDVGLMPRSDAIGGGVARADKEDMPVTRHHEVEYDAGENHLAAPRAGSRHCDQREAAIVSSGQHDAEVEAVAHVADREKMAMAAARRISDLTGTQYGAALAEVRSALMRSDGGDEQGEARRAAEEEVTWTTLPEQAPALLGARHPPADQATSGELPSAAGNGVASCAGDRLQRKRTQDQTEILTSSSLVPGSYKHQRKGSDSDVQVLTGAERGHRLPDPRPRQHQPSLSRVPNIHGYNSARQHHASIGGGGMRNDKTSGLGRRRQQGADDGGGREGRPLSGGGQDDGQETKDTHGEVYSRPGAYNNDVTSSARPGGRLGLSGPKESRWPRSNNDSRKPDKPTSILTRDKRRRGQRPSSSPPAASTDVPGLAEAAEKRGKVEGAKRFRVATPGENVERTAARSKSANTTDEVVPNIGGHGLGRISIDSSGAEKEQSVGSGHSSTASAQNNDPDRFARDRPGDRYYLPPPQRNSRPRTSPDGSGSTNSSTPRPHERRRKYLQPRSRELCEDERQEGQHGQQRKTSHDMPRRGGGDDNVDSSSSLQPRRREARKNSSSDRLYCQQPADHRPIRGPSEETGASNMPDWRYGWRGSFTKTSLAQSQDEESLPYYMDRKQVWQFVPPDGLPPWRDPGPGEPGWEPILNYCEVKPDEEEVMEERKRRDFLCERRSRSRGRGGDWSITTGVSSVEGRSNSLTSARSRSSSVRERTDYSEGSGTTGGGDSPREGEGDEEDDHEDGDDGGDDEEPLSSVEFPIARRVNARRPSTTATGIAARSKQQDNAAANIAGSSSSFSAASPVGHQPQTSESPSSQLRLPDNHISSLGSGDTSAKEELATDDFLPSAQTTSTAGAARSTIKRPRTSGHAIAAPSGASSSRFLSPLLDADGASVGSSPLQLVNTTAHAAGATAAPASTVGGKGRALLEYAHNRRRHSSLSFAQNPHVTTTEMIRRYRIQLRRASWSSQQQRARVATTLTAMPPLLAGDRRRSGDSSTPWHYYVTTNNAVGSGPVSRPRASIGGSRWSQDVRFQQHTRGRSRLAPATRTAGGRWGANHGRLEALVPGDESEASSTSITYRIPPEGGGPWVLEAEPRIELMRRHQQEYPLPF